LPSQDSQVGDRQTAVDALHPLTVPRLCG
jgi:hypothetical protein